MFIKEYRVILPMTVEEYEVAQLWTVIEASKGETGGGDGVEILVNEPFTTDSQYAPTPTLPGGEAHSKGQYTHKIYHLASKVPAFIRTIAPEGSLTVTENAWNAYPYCRTVITNDYMKQDFFLRIETMHIQDKIDLENVHELTPEQLAMREVVYIDITSDKHTSPNSKWDPKTFKSEKTGRGPLSHPRWWENTDLPVMCAYKLVTCNFKWFGLQTIVESYIASMERKLFHNFHRQLFCDIDKWYGLTIADIRQMEADTKLELDKQRQEGELRGTIETS